LKRLFFLTEGAKKDALFDTICGLDSEVELLKTMLASVNIRCPIIRQFLESKRRVSLLNLWCAILFFFVQFCVACSLKFFAEFCVSMLC
jgi:hypothetical protein